MSIVEIVEERKEQCSVASKIVSVKIVRRKTNQGYSGDGEIIGFDCSDISPNSESRCTYRMLMDDF